MRVNTPSVALNLWQRLKQISRQSSRSNLLELAADRPVDPGALTQQRAIRQGPLLRRGVPPGVPLPERNLRVQGVLEPLRSLDYVGDDAESRRVLTAELRAQHAFAALERDPPG